MLLEEKNMQAPITSQVLQMIRTYAYDRGMSLSELSRHTGVSKAWISRLQHEDANLSLDTATELLASIGYRLEIKPMSTIKK